MNDMEQGLPGNRKQCIHDSIKGTATDHHCGVSAQLKRWSARAVDGIGQPLFYNVGTMVAGSDIFVCNICVSHYRYTYKRIIYLQTSQSVIYHHKPNVSSLRLTWRRIGTPNFVSKR